MSLFQAGCSTSRSQTMRGPGHKCKIRDEPCVLLASHKLSPADRTGILLAKLSDGSVSSRQVCRARVSADLSRRVRRGDLSTHESSRRHHHAPARGVWQSLFVSFTVREMCRNAVRSASCSCWSRMSISSENEPRLTRHQHQPPDVKRKINRGLGSDSRCLPRIALRGAPEI